MAEFAHCHEFQDKLSLLHRGFSTLTLTSKSVPPTPISLINHPIKPAMEQKPSLEGSVPFAIPSIATPCFTYYKVIGDRSGGVPPVVMLHGGPGGGHEYLLPFANLWSRYGIPVVFYDQVGCAASTHLPEKAGDGSFWTEALFVAELDNLLDHLGLRDGPGFHLFGHSWGGMLGAAFAAQRPRGLRRLVLAAALASHASCVRGVHLLRQQLVPEQQATLLDAARRSDWQSAAVQEVLGLLGGKHVCRTTPPPAELALAMQHLSEDTTVYRTMYVSQNACFGSALSARLRPPLHEKSDSLSGGATRGWSSMAR